MAVGGPCKPLSLARGIAGVADQFSSRTWLCHQVREAPPPRFSLCLCASVVNLYFRGRCLAETDRMISFPFCVAVAAGLTSEHASAITASTFESAIPPADAKRT